MEPELGSKVQPQGIPGLPHIDLVEALDPPKLLPRGKNVRRLVAVHCNMRSQFSLLHGALDQLMYSLNCPSTPAWLRQLRNMLGLVQCQLHNLTINLTVAP